jgi:hypothetical protein
LLDRVIFGHAHPCFYSDCLVLSCHQVTFCPWWSKRWRISWRPDWRTNYGGLSLCTIERLLDFSGFRCSSIKVGMAAQVKFRVLPFRVKIQNLSLIGCASQWPCWRHCFASGDYLQSENLKYVMRRQLCLCTVPFLKTSLLKSLEFMCRIGGGYIVAARAGTP